MPKPLSLKKPQQKQPPKGQKSITIFFKNTNGCAPLKHDNPQNRSECLEKPFKRKAESPCKVINQNDHESCSSKSSPKKIKIETKSPKKSSPNNSPHKENGNHGFENCSRSQSNDLERSPLTPVCVDNVKCDLMQDRLISNDDKLCQTNKNNVNFVRPEPAFQNNSNAEIEKSLDVCVSSTSLKIAPMKVSRNKLTLSKSGSPVKILDFCENDVSDCFDDDWAFADNQDIEENLDLTSIQRCEVLSVTRHPTHMVLQLKDSDKNIGTCIVEGTWLDTSISQGEIVSVLASKDASGQFKVSNNGGLISLRPDHLVSSTSVVAGVFCKRKAVLQERWRGIDSANTAMTIGILIHELVQKALTHKIMDIAKLSVETDAIIRNSVQMLYDAGLNQEESRSNMQAYIAPLADFMQTYVGAPKSGICNQKKDKWGGHVNKVLDIEESVCCPQLGLKGKIDATLEVTIHDRKGRERAVVPLELKSGKASMSAEHRGQLVMYGMMMSLQRGEDPAQAMQNGLLLYLKDRVEIREVKCGYPERRDLVMLRNQLVQHLAPAPTDTDPEQVIDIEEASVLLQQSLPEPVHHHSACTKCPYLTICSLHLWHTCGPTVSDEHPLTKLREPALGHLSAEHIKYFLHWTALLKMEERGQMIASPLHALWTDSIDNRVKRGTCAAYLRLERVEPSGGRYMSVFIRDSTGNDNTESKLITKGPQASDFCIVSIDNRPWIAAGGVVKANESEIIIILERDLSRRFSKDSRFCIDTYESYATTVQNLTNLGVLIEDSDRAYRLRQIIIDKQSTEFEKKLPREVGRLGSKLMRSLNIEQQRAVLKALAAKDYALLRGLPGTGKTQTISVLIQMLVALKQRVLVTAHTHSAVDTVLSRIPETVRVMRLGSSSRVAAALRNRCEQHLAATCNTPELLAEMYESMEVVGVTCLGAAHAMLARTTFDVCIVDEATQVLQCTVLRPLFAAKRFIMVGDPDQLPPVVRSRAARRLGMEESLFHRLMKDDSTTTLKLQYRMNQRLVDVANQVAYDGQLKCANSTVADSTISVDTQKLSDIGGDSWLQLCCSPEPGDAALFLDMSSMNCESGEGYRTSNSDEACLVFAIVETLLKVGVSAADIGVIAPYRDQVGLLRRCLAPLAADVSTVDQFQGRDKSIIIYSCTRRGDGRVDKKVREGEVLNDQRRLAVSVTRAKHKFILIGNSKALQRYKPLQRLIEQCNTVALDVTYINSIVDKYKTVIL